MNEREHAEPAVETRKLVFAYGERRALDGVSLSVDPGTVVGLLGPNGSGKSTLLSTVAGLRVPLEGDVRVHGRPPGPAVRSRVGVVFQENSVDPLMTLHETLELHGRLFGVGGPRLRRRIEELLKSFGLADRASDRVETLSGGLRRRLELARALLPDPNVVLLDEPTSGLDLDSRRSFWENLRAARGANGGPPLTVLLATNDVAEAERECERVAFLYRGKLVAEGTPGELKAGLKHESVLVECADGRAQALRETVVSWPGVGRATSAGPVLHVTVDEASSFVPRLFQAESEGIRSIRIESSTLEDAYFQVAGAPFSEAEETVGA